MPGTGERSGLVMLVLGLAGLGLVGALLAPSGQAAPRGLAALPHQVLATVAVGARPLGIGVNPVSGKVYVSNAGAGTVSVIDAATNTVVKTIPVGDEPYRWVAVMPERNRIFVVNHAGDSLSVIDGATDTVVATLTGLSGGPEGVAAHEARDRVYVSRAGDTLSVVDPALPALLQDLDTGARNSGVVVNPLLDRAYVALGTPGRLAVYDLANLDKLVEIGASGQPALDSYTQRIWLADAGGARLWLVNGLTHNIDGSVALTFPPLMAAIDAPRGCLYASYPSVGLLSVVDIVHRRELGALGVGQRPAGVGVDPTTGRVYVANEGANTVTVIQGERCDLVGTTTPTPGSTREPYPGPYTATPTASLTPEPSPTAPVTPSPRPPATDLPSPTAVIATATATVTLPPSPSATTTATVRPGPTRPPPCVCRDVRQRVPAVVVDDALANPDRYYGWLYPLDPGKPPSPANPPRTCLTLRTVALDYHPVWNRPQWRVGCP